ncbi:MAG: Fpg/Nei family DNA glycosylase [Candidatus Eiseniibacteriota bacterium]
MPELPELTVYRERLAQALAGRRVGSVALRDSFVLRTVEPAVATAEGRLVTGASRRSKFLIVELEGPLCFAFHLMLSGRLHLKRHESFRPHARRTVLSVHFDGGTVLEMTEAGKERRASLHMLRRPSDLPRIERGIEPLSEEFTADLLARILRERNRQLKGALRDPELVSGLGNAYSDEILFAARLSPLRMTARLDDAEIARLHAAIRDTVELWIGRIRAVCPEGLPVKQDLWRRDMAVHGRAGSPCPQCGGVISRISFRGSETCYCPDCQNEGRLLADRRLSRLGIRRRGV